LLVPLIESERFGVCVAVGVAVLVMANAPGAISRIIIGVAVGVFEKLRAIPRITEGVPVGEFVNVRPMPRTALRFPVAEIERLTKYAVPLVISHRPPAPG
jgi:hypothetical protein